LLLSFKPAHNGGLAKHRGNHRLFSDNDSYASPTNLDAKAKPFTGVQVVHRAADAAQGFGADMGVNLRGLAAGVAEQCLNVANLLRMSHIYNSWG
jgi:hypothetical protein